MAGTKIARVSAANLIPPMLAPKDCNTSKDMWVTSKVDLGEKDAWVGMNVMPNIIKTSVPHSPDDKQVVQELTPVQLNQLFENLDLSGIEVWVKEDQEGVQSLIKEFGSLFTLDNLDLGKTSIVKHNIKLTDMVPFKERYKCISPHQF